MNASRTDSLLAGLFDTFQLADQAVARLVSLGVSEDRISVVCSERLPDMTADVETIEGKPTERRLPGIVAGGAIGSTLGGLSAAAGLLATGGTGLLLVGPLFGAAAAGGMAGGFVGLMMSRGLEPEVADFYDQALERGSILVAVESPRQSDEPGDDDVRRVLEQNGARFFVPST